jgi:hypothetical protein
MQDIANALHRKRLFDLLQNVKIVVVFASSSLKTKSSEFMELIKMLDLMFRDTNIRELAQSISFGVSHASDEGIKQCTRGEFEKTLCDKRKHAKISPRQVEIFNAIIDQNKLVYFKQPSKNMNLNQTFKELKTDIEQ